MIATTDLVAGFNRPEDIKSAISALAGNLLMVELNRNALLAAFAYVESQFGQQDIARYEPAYGLDGLYFRKSKDLQLDYYKKYGPFVSMSYGPWQILYPTAKSLGYLGHPLDLSAAIVSCPYVIDFMNHLFKRGASTIEKLAQGYNSGRFDVEPSAGVKKYISELVQSYQRFDLSYK